MQAKKKKTAAEEDNKKRTLAMQGDLDEAEEEKGGEGGDGKSKNLLDGGKDEDVIF